jgi:TrmH family RNA methyltransferase
MCIDSVPSTRFSTITAVITSRQNPRLKALRRLSRSNRERGDRVLLEGPHLLAEALASGLVPDEVYVSPDLAAGDPEVARLLARLAEPPAAELAELVELVEVAADVLAELADADAPKGLLAVARLPRGGAETLPAPSPGSPLLYLDGVQDPGNLGAIARSAEAAGAAGLALAPGCAHPSHPRALRGSAGSLLRLPAAVGVSPRDLDRRLADSAGGPPRWAVLAVRDGRSLWRVPDDDLAGPLVLAVGAEGPGLSDAVRDRADLRLTIPLAPPVESLNAAVAAAIVLFELRRRAT